MLDLAGIVISTVFMLYIIFRAVQLDRSMPWFEKPSAKPVETPEPPAPPHERAPWRIRR